MLGAIKKGLCGRVSRHGQKKEQGQREGNLSGSGFGEEEKQQPGVGKDEIKNSYDAKEDRH